MTSIFNEFNQKLPINHFKEISVLKMTKFFKKLRNFLKKNLNYLCIYFLLPLDSSDSQIKNRIKRLAQPRIIPDLEYNLEDKRKDLKKILKHFSCVILSSTRFFIYNQFAHLIYPLIYRSIFYFENYKKLACFFLPLF